MRSVNYPIMTVDEFLHSVAVSVPIKIKTDEAVIYDGNSVEYPDYLDDLFVYDFWVSKQGVALLVDVPVCSECGKPMTSGYCIADGEEYYCSDECLHKHYTEEEYNEMYENDEAYWTTWE